MFILFCFRLLLRLTTSRHASLVLKLPHSTASLAPDITLLDLDLVPRGILVVRMQDDESYVLHVKSIFKNHSCEPVL